MLECVKICRRNTANIGLLTILLVILSISFPEKAKAGFGDTVKNFVQLPDKVDELSNKYNQTKEQLEQNIQALEETRKQTAEAFRSYEEAERKWAAEKDQLKQQNDGLQLVVQELRNAEEKRSKQYRTIVRVTLTAIGLVLLYFVMMRVLRMVLRSR